MIQLEPTVLFTAVGLFIAMAAMIIALAVYLTSRMDKLESSLHGDMSELRVELKTDVAELKKELKGELAQMRSDFSGEISGLRSDQKVLETRVFYLATGQKQPPLEGTGLLTSHRVALARA